MTATHKFNPAAFDPKAYANQHRKTDTTFAVVYDALEEQFAALAALLKTRAAAGLTPSRGGVKHGRISTRCRSHWV
jgi:hypothetical protein